MNTYRPEYYLAGRNRLRHIRDAFSKQGYHAENYCLECKGKKPLDWTKENEDKIKKEVV